MGKIMSNKISFVISDVTSKGGTERMTTLLSTLLSELDDSIQVEIFSLNNELKIPFYSLPDNVIVKCGSGKKYYDLCKYIVFCKKNNIKLIVVSMGRLSFECAFLARFLFFKNIYLYEHVGLLSFNKLIVLLKLSSFFLAKKVIVLTSNDFCLLTNGYKLKNVVHIPNINPFSMKNIKITEYCSRPNIAIAIGRYTAQKNFQALISIWKKANLSGWCLYIIGDGEERNDLEKKIGEDSTIKLLSSTYDISHYYNLAKLYLMTSNYEGLPMVLIESQSFGIPVIAYDCPTGPAEIVRNGITGSLIELHNVERFVEELKSFTSNENKLKILSENSLNNSRLFDVKVVIKKWCSLLQLSENYEK